MRFYVSEKQGLRRWFTFGALQPEQVILGFPDPRTRRNHYA